MTHHDFRAFGLNIRSDWAIPSLVNSDFETPDVHIRHTSLAPHLDAEWHAGKKSFRNWEAMPGRFLMKIHGVADYLAMNGDTVLIDRADDDVGDDAVTVYMMGSIMAAILQQRDICLLHGGSVQIGGKAAIFVGKSGMGKSTLTVKLMLRGHSLIADDVSAIAWDSETLLSVIPAFPTSRLWGDALKKMELGNKVRHRVRPELEKFLVSSENFCESPQSISAIYVLRQHNKPDIRIDALGKRDSHHILNLQGFRNGFLKGHASYLHHFKTLMEIANTIPVFEVYRPIDGFAIDALADAVTEHNLALVQR